MDTPLPEAIGFSSPIDPVAFDVLSLLVVEAPDAVLTVSANDGLWIIPLTGPATTDCDRFRSPFANTISSAGVGSGRSICGGAIESLDFVGFAGGTVSEVDCEAETNRRNRFALSREVASFAFGRYLLRVHLALLFRLGRSAKRVMCINAGRSRRGRK